jgi:hypothetical protein
LLILEHQTTAEDATDGEIPSNATHPRMERQQSEQEKKEKALSDQNVRLLATNLLEKISSGTLDVVEGTDQPFTMMRTAKYDEQSRRLELVTDGSQAVSEPSEEIKASDLNKASYPILTDFGLPLSSVFLSTLLRELVMLDRTNPKGDILIGKTSSLHYYYLAFVVLTYLAYLIAVNTSHISFGYYKPGHTSPHCIRFRK